MDKYFETTIHKPCVTVLTSRQASNTIGNEEENVERQKKILANYSNFVHLVSCSKTKLNAKC